MNRPAAGGRRERGSVAVELVLGYVPLMILTCVAVVACLRLVSASIDVNAAAAAAARQASLGRDPAAAVAGGRDAAAATLAGRSITCQTFTVTVDTAGLAPGGQVAATVVCRIQLADLYGLGLPGSVTVSGAARQPVDSYRRAGP